MAGTVVHLAVAVGLNQRFLQSPKKYLGEKWSSYQMNDFIAGNICPDGIMARKGYRREMKLHTHFRDCIPDGTFQDPDNLQLFRSRLLEFFHGNVYIDQRNFPLYLGYLTHMLTDEKFILEIHGNVLQRLEKLGYTKDNPETFRIFGKDTDQNDFRLVKEYPGIMDAYTSLIYVRPYEIADLITEEELSESREWIMNYFFETDHELTDLKVLYYEEIKAFIPKVIDEILQRLPEYIR